VEESAGEESLDVSEVLLSLMGEKEKLSELAKLTGKMRDAVRSGDRSYVAEARQEFERLARYVPEKFKPGRLLEVAGMPGEKGDRLADLTSAGCNGLSEYTTRLAKTTGDRRPRVRLTRRRAFENPRTS